MHMARRVAAWVAWAAWTCKIAPLQATPAIAGYSLKESGLRPALFFGAASRPADLLLGTSALCLKQFGLIEDDPVLDACAARCQRRPAWQRAQAFDQG
jgi:hypothetical protein